MSMAVFISAATAVSTRSTPRAKENSYPPIPFPLLSKYIAISISISISVIIYLYFYFYLQLITL